MYVMNSVNEHVVVSVLALLMYGGVACIQCDAGFNPIGAFSKVVGPAVICDMPLNKFFTMCTKTG
jgi:hypothetical protein